MSQTGVEEEEKQSIDDSTDKTGWRNLYLWLSDGIIHRGAFLWNTYEEAKKAAEERTNPHRSEYIGTFKEPA
jgi:hypothetical protein